MAALRAEVDTNRQIFSLKKACNIVIFMLLFMVK